MVTISITDLTKRYGTRTLFKDLTFRFESNRIYGISGRNGSGKSTFLKILLGHTSPSAGAISITDESGKKTSPDEWALRTNFTAPYLDLPLEFTAREFFKFHFSIRKSVAKSPIDQIFELYQFPRQVKIRDYSSGMMQRLRLFTVFYTEADILLLDEPTETLDLTGIELFHELTLKCSPGRVMLIASNKSEDFKNVHEVLDIESFSNSIR